MESEQISRLLNTPEGTNLELKKSLAHEDRVAQTVCAFANTFGGYLIVGAERAEDNTNVFGVSDPDTAFQKLAGIVSRVHPKPFYQPKEHHYEGKTILVVRVDPAPLSEICFIGTVAYRRVGSVNERLEGQHLVHFMQQRGTVSFEENRSNAQISDISKEKVHHILEKKVQDLKKHQPLRLKSVLESLGVANAVGEFYLKNAAIFFFARNVQKFFMNPEVRIVKYRGKVKTLEARMFDERLVDTLPELLHQAFIAIKEQAGTFGRIVEGRRKEEAMIPDEVLREALTNAVGHRDYFDPNGILIEIFDDRMEITNPGTLLPGQTIKNFGEMRKHRNPIIYRLLNDSEWGEGLNLGVKAMYRIMRENKLPDPEFEDLGSMFKVTLFGPLSERKRRPYGLINSRQEKAIEYLKVHSSLTAPVYAKMVGISHPTGIRDLNELVAQGVLSKSGRYRSSHYVLEKVK